MQYTGEDMVNYYYSCVKHLIEDFDPGTTISDGQLYRYLHNLNGCLPSNTSRPDPWSMINDLTELGFIKKESGMNFFYILPSLIDLDISRDIRYF